MIRCSYIKNRTKSCDNCNRVTTFVLKYTFSDMRGTKRIEHTHTTLYLCEDCSNAVKYLSNAAMENGESFNYDIDEIKKTEEL